MKYLYSFYWDYGRSGSLDGLFVATEEEVANAIGQEVNFGEVLGKHSEVYGTLEEGNISKLDVSSEAVIEVSTHLGLNWSGFNPLDYVRTTCDECGDSFNKDDGEAIFRVEYEKVMCEYCVRRKEKEEDEMNGE